MRSAFVEWISKFVYFHRRDEWRFKTILPSDIFRKCIDKFEFAFIVAETVVNRRWFKKLITIAMEGVWQNRMNNVYGGGCLWTEIFAYVWLKSKKNLKIYKIILLKNSCEQILISMWDALNYYVPWRW